MKTIKNFLPVNSVIRAVPFEQEKKVILQEIRKIDPKVQVQFGAQLKVFTGRMKMASDSDAQFNVDFSGLSPIQAQELAAILHAARSGPGVDCFFKVFLLSAQLLFKTQLTRAGLEGAGSKALPFVFPVQVFKVHRRKHLRVPIGKDTPAFARIPGVGDRRIADLSLMGAKILLEPGDEKTIAQNRSLKDFRFVLDGSEKEAQVEVRYLDAKMVGINVLYMNSPDRQWLKDYLMGQIRKLLSDPDQIQSMS